MEEEYSIENDPNLMEAINHFAKESQNESYKYKFIEIMREMQHTNVVSMKNLNIIDKKFKCPIIDKIIKASDLYLGVEINNKEELKHYIGGEGRGKSKTYKLDFDNLRKAIISMW